MANDKKLIENMKKTILEEAKKFTETVTKPIKMNEGMKKTVEEEAKRFLETKPSDISYLGRKSK